MSEAISFGKALTTTNTTLLTVPASTTRYITQVQVCNVDGTNDADVTISWTDSSDSDTEYRLAYQITVAAKDSRTMLAGSFAMNAGDTLKGLSSADGDLEVVVTYYDEAV